MNSQIYECHNPGCRYKSEEIFVGEAVYTMEPKLRTPQAVVEALFRERARPASADESPAQHKRVWASLDTEAERGQDRVFAWMAEQVGARVGSEDQEIPCIMDGQDSLWKDARSHLVGYQVVEILDLLHVTSRIWDAAHLFYAEGSSAATAFARARIESILEGKVGRVVGGMRQMATKRRLSASKRRRLETICGYLEKNRHRMRYDEYLARGYPIASGVIEGACRYVVKDRMERAGMRWTEEGAQAMLDLRSTHVNGQWEEFQTYRIERERERLYPNQEALEKVEWPFAA